MGLSWSIRLVGNWHDFHQLTMLLDKQDQFMYVYAKVKKTKPSGVCNDFIDINTQVDPFLNEFSCRVSVFSILGHQPQRFQGPFWTFYVSPLCSAASNGFPTNRIWVLTAGNLTGKHGTTPIKVDDSHALFPGPFSMANCWIVRGLILIPGPLIQLQTSQKVFSWSAIYRY